MGFYGRVNNATSNASFTIDRIYPNRANMDKNCATDGIFIGRYVLVDYHEGEPGEINYQDNFTIDQEQYGTGEPYDSTVWQKTLATNGSEKYVMVAELNSVVPTFGLTVDAPTLNPIPPHFDADTSNVYYRLHVQPSWGFKIKETDEDKSDEQASNLETIWEPNYNDPDKGTYKVWGKEYPGAIYYNKAGLDPTYKTLNEHNKSDNSIVISADGKSGRKYNVQHNTGVREEEAVDVYQLTMNLPGIGNAVSDMWDLVYGDATTYADPDPKNPNTYRRNQMIDWDNVSGLRLVEEDPEGSGFKYTPKKVNTLAGCINSVHDLMGMIVVDEQINDIDDALTNRIYYGAYDKKKPTHIGYFIKDLTYEYDETQKDTVSQLLEDLKDFNKGTYYYLNKKNYYLEVNGYRAGNKYYSLENKIAEINLATQEYKPGIYFYKDGDDYILEWAEWPDESKTYYEISEDKDIEVDSTKHIYFFPTDMDYFNKYFKKVEIDNGDGRKLGTGLFYSEIDPNSKATIYKPYLPGKIAYRSPLYWVENYLVETTTSIDGDVVEVFDFEKAGTVFYEYQMVEFKKDFFYHREGFNNILLDSEKDIDINKVYFGYDEDGIVEVSLKFYEPDLYYYKEGNDYILATEDYKISDRTYYEIQKDLEQINDRFYEPNKYYYKDANGEFVLAFEEKMDENKDYYEVFFVHVKEGNGIYEDGAKWNMNVSVVPEGVKVGVRTEKYEWKELTGFSRTLNTIHGLILEINNIIKFEDKLTRDTNTVQGCINSLKDIINQFDRLVPGHILMVNEYGKATSDNISNMKLTGYFKDEEDGDVLPEDTLGQALSKLQTQIIKEQNDRVKDSEEIAAALAQEIADRKTAIANEAKARAEADTAEANAREKAISDEITAREAAITKEVSDRDNAISNAIAQEISDRNEAIAVETEARIKAISDEKSEREKQLAQEIANREAANDELLTAIQTETANRTQALNALQLSSAEPATGVGSTVITTISQVAGQVNATERKIGELTLSGYELKNNVSHIAYTDTINDAFSKVQSQIDNLYVRNDGINKEVKENYLRKEEFNVYKEQIEIRDKAQDKLIEDLGEIVSDQGVQITNIENNLNSQAKDIELLFTRNDGINKEVKENYVRKEELNPVITDIGALEELVENLGETVNSHGGLIEGINESIESQGKDIELLFVRNDGINQEVKENYVRKTELNEIIQGLLETINKMEERIVELEEQINS